MTPIGLRVEPLFDRIALVHETPHEALVIELEIADAEVLLDELARYQGGESEGGRTGRLRACPPTWSVELGVFCNALRVPPDHCPAGAAFISASTRHSDATGVISCRHAESVRQPARR